MERIYVKEVRNLVTERIMAWLTDIQPKNASYLLIINKYKQNAFDNNNKKICEGMRHGSGE